MCGRGGRGRGGGSDAAAAAASLRRCLGSHQCKFLTAVGMQYNNYLNQ